MIANAIHRLRTYGHITTGGSEERIEFDIAASAQAENGAAVIEQIELDIAAAAHELFLAFGIGPRQGAIPSHQFGIDVTKCAADILREREIGLPIAAVEVVVKNSADPAHLVAMLQKEILVAPFLEFVIRRDGGMRVACSLHRGMEGDGVRVVMPPRRLRARA